MDLRAVILYLRATDLPRALRHCAHRGYHVAALVPADRYGDAVQLVLDGRVQVVVAASADALSDDRIPRIEVVGEGDTGSSE